MRTRQTVWVDEAFEVLDDKGLEILSSATSVKELLLVDTEATANAKPSQAKGLGLTGRKGWLVNCHHEVRIALREKQKNVTLYISWSFSVFFFSLFQLCIEGEFHFVVWALVSYYPSPCSPVGSAANRAIPKHTKTIVASGKRLAFDIF